MRSEVWTVCVSGCLTALSCSGDEDEAAGFICGLISISHPHTKEPEDKKRSKKRSMKETTK